jgi:hypothetical protein
MIPLEGNGGVEPQTTSAAHTLFESGLVPDKFVTQNIPKAGEEDGSDPSVPAVVCVLCLQAGPCVDLPVKHSRVFALTSGLPLREELDIQLFT